MLNSMEEAADDESTYDAVTVKCHNYISSLKLNLINYHTTKY